MNLEFLKRLNNHNMYVANLDSDIVSVIETELNGYGTTSGLSRRKCKKLEQDSIYEALLSQ